MTRFSATDAALEGFRIARQRPRLLLAWAAFSFFASMLGAVITLIMPEDSRLALESLASDDMYLAIGAVLKNIVDKPNYAPRRPMHDESARHHAGRSPSARGCPSVAR